jgi:hypothetical protein
MRWVRRAPAREPVCSPRGHRRGGPPPPPVSRPTTLPEGKRR